MNKPIIATWGTGPTYRNRIKHNIQKAIDTGYDNIMDYIILTDYPDDFDEFRLTNNKIVDVIDIHKIRETHPWSKELEYIPLSRDPEEYGRDYRESKHAGKNFSYALNRFSLPTIAELGYSKFVMCDCDVDIRYDKIVSGECTEEQFWNEYDTPINTMKGCDYEHHDLSNILLPFNDFVGHNMMLTSRIELGSIFRYELGKKYKEEYASLGPYLSKITQTEGPFRYYNLESPALVKRYFEMWEDVMKICYDDIFLMNLMCGGTYMTIDNIPVSIVNQFLKITPLNFDKFWHTVNIYYIDRHFFPRGVAIGDGLSLMPTDSEESFLQINKEAIECLKKQNYWAE